MFGHLPDRVMSEEHIREDLNLGKCFGCSNALFRQCGLNYVLTCNSTNHYGSVCITEEQYKTSQIKTLQHYRALPISNKRRIIFDGSIKTLGVIKEIVIHYAALDCIETQMLKMEVKSMEEMQKIIEEKDLKIKELQELIVAYRKVVGDLSK